MKMIRIYNDNVVDVLKDNLKKSNELNNTKVTLSELIENIIADYIATQSHLYDNRFLELEKQIYLVREQQKYLINYIRELNEQYNTIIESLILDDVDLEMIEDE